MADQAEGLRALVAAQTAKLTLTDKGGKQSLRSDGLAVWMDESTGDKIAAALNTVRRLDDKQAVVLAVGAVRGMQIARNYAQRYAPDLVTGIERQLAEWADSVTQRLG